MGEILEKAEVARIRALVLYEGSGERWDAEELADSHELLRARLERIEQQRDDLRAVLLEAGGYVDLCGIRAGRNVSDSTIDLSRRIVAIRRATREKETER